MKNLITKKEKDRIDKVCKKYEIQNYSINSDGSIDVNGDVNLKNYTEINKLPIRFGKITGDFTCISLGIYTFDGFPHTVGGHFICSYSWNLTSMVGGPSIVGGDYIITANAISALDGVPDMITGTFTCTGNKLLNLIGSPSTVTGSFNCAGNSLTNLVGGPKTVGGDYNFGGNTSIISLKGCAATIGGNIQYFRNSIISTYSGDVDIEYGGGYSGYDHMLPKIFIDNLKHIKIILRYQRHFEIWNDDLSLNVGKFNELIAEIEDGLE